MEDRIRSQEAGTFEGTNTYVSRRNAWTVGLGSTHKADSLVLDTVAMSDGRRVRLTTIVAGQAPVTILLDVDKARALQGILGDVVDELQLF